MPGTAPTGWQNPKTSYTADDALTPDQFERIEGNIYAIEQGERTIDPSQAPTGVVGHLRNFLDWFANRIRAILGTTNWHDAPPTTLQAAKNHIDAAAPHSGHATTAALTAHANATGAVHGATTAATANTLALRDAGGRLKAAAPVEADDVARKADLPAPSSPYPPYTASDNLLASHDAEQTMRGTSYVKLKTITIPSGGQFRIKFDLHSSDGFTACARIYRNGVAVGTERRTTSSSYVTQSEDISGFQAGDTVELWARMIGTSNWDVYVRNFRLYGTPIPPTFTIS
mgnify:CR=1 FL=1